MAFPGAYCEFGGIPIDSAEVTISRGATPSTAILRTTPDAPVSLSRSDLSLYFDGSSVLRLVDAVPETAYTRIEHDGFGVRWHITVYDRRKIWEGIPLYGEFNLRYPNGSVNPRSKQTVRDLLQVAFLQAGEQNVVFDFDPPAVYPYVRWDGCSAASQIGMLCRSVACDIVLGSDNRIHVVGRGIGSDLTYDERERIDNFPFNASKIPYSIILVGGPIAYQARFLLSAVGWEVDGSIKPVNELSYKPEDGWETSDMTPLHFGSVDPTYRHLAQASVFKWYRIKYIRIDNHAHLGFPGSSTPVNNINQFLPLNDELAVLAKYADGSYARIGAMIDGNFWPYCDVPTPTRSGRVYTGKFTVDGQAGIVKFDYPVVACQDSGLSVGFPTMYLTTSFGIRSNDTQMQEQYTRQRVIGGTAPPLRIFRPEITCVTAAMYDDTGKYTGIYTNRAEADAEADLYLDAFQREALASPMYEMEYDTLVPVEFDGRIAQVRYSTWNGRGAATHASVNFEFDVLSGDEERRRARELSDTSEKARAAEICGGKTSYSSIYQNGALPG
jgi:hypothetical protein